MKVPALLFAVKYSFLSMLRFWRNRVLVRYSFLSMLRFWRNRLLVLQCESQVDH